MMNSTQETKALSGDPFSLFPSLLSMRNLRRTLKKKLTPPLSLQTIHRLLSLDPLALARGLRLANAPLRNPGHPVETVKDLILTLGGPACEALFGGPAVDATGTQRIRRLWLYSLATAHAAGLLAQTSGDLTPEQAYTAGLVHALPRFLDLLFVCRESEGIPQAGALAFPAWKLTPRLTAFWQGEFEGKSPGGGSPSSPSMDFLQGARHLAEMSGFHPPDFSPSEEDLLEAIYEQEPSLAHTLRERVEQSLESLGLGIQDLLRDPPLLRPTRGDQVPLSGKAPSYDVGKASNLILEFTRGESLQTAVTVLLAAVRKYLGFDRAWFLRWSGPGGKVRFRLAQDLTPYPIACDQVALPKEEAAWLGNLAEKGEPALLDRSLFPRSALLEMVGADSAVLAPVGPNGPSHGFLMADKGLQGRPIRHARLEDLKAVCGTAGLLAENLLVQRVAWRHGTAANMDPLTGVYNRRSGLTRLARYMEKSRHTGKVVTLIMVDVDDFKKVNDTWGHQAGDQVLKRVARALLDRFDDIGLVSRIGGEEFLVILPERAPEEVIPYVEEVRQAVENASVSLEEGKNEVKVTISLGVTITHPTLDTPEKALHRADQALYASKQMGKNRFSVDPGDWDE